MKIETTELVYLQDLLHGRVAQRPGTSNFTAQDVLVLREKIARELKSRAGAEIPPDWREQAQAFILSGRATECAPSKALRDLEKHKSRVEGNRLGALPVENLLAELGL